MKFFNKLNVAGSKVSRNQMSLVWLTNHHHHHLCLIYFLFLQQILGDKDFIFTHKPMKDFMKNLCTTEFMHQLCSHLIFLPGTYNVTNLNMVSLPVKYISLNVVLGCVSLNFTKVSSSRQKVSFQRMESFASSTHPLFKCYTFFKKNENILGKRQQK